MRYKVGTYSSLSHVSFPSTDLLFLWRPLGTIYIDEGDRSSFERRRDRGEHGK